MPGNRRTRKAILVTSVILFCIAAAFLTLNRNGILALLELREEREELQSEVDSLEQRIEELQTEIDLLQSDSFYMEKAVREILGWGRPDELIIRFLDRSEL